MPKPNFPRFTNKKPDNTEINPDDTDINPGNIEISPDDIFVNYFNKSGSRNAL